MPEKHTIGNLARRTGIPVSTIRYYEREGLVRPQRRSEGNYRLYDREAIERIRFIRAAQATGFTLADIKLLLAYRDGRLAPCAEVRSLIENRLKTVEQRMVELRHVRKILTGFLATCRTTAENDPCPVLEEIEPDEHPQSGRRRRRTAGR